jgi:hypothetical protein
MRLRDPGIRSSRTPKGLVTGTLLVTVGVAFQRHVGLVTRHVAGFALLVSLWTLLVSLWTGVFFGPRVRTVRSRVIPLK